MVHEEIDEDMDRMITPHIISRRLGITPNMVIAEIKTGKLRAFKIGRLWKIKESDYDTYLKTIEYQPDEA